MAKSKKLKILKWYLFFPRAVCPYIAYICMSDFFDDSDKYQLDFSICHISGQIPILIGQLKKQIKANKVNWNKQISASEPAGRRGGIGPRGAVSTQKNTTRKPQWRQGTSKDGKWGGNEKKSGR